MIRVPSTPKRLRKMEGKVEGKGKHFVLVHGACHGAWSWYKLTALLEQAGHHVTAVDLGASGRREEKLFELKGGFSDYVKPLMEMMEALPIHEKVILVGHSFGGLSLAWASEAFPDKVLVAVYSTAFMPDCSHHPFYTIEQYFASVPPGYLLDTQVEFDSEMKEFAPILHFGPVAMKHKLYQKCSPEDLILGLSLIKRSSLFKRSLSNAPKFSKEKYGSVPRVFILCKEDEAIQEFYQRRMIENFPPKVVKEINTSDHMPMLATPEELFNHLFDIAKDDY